MTALTTVLPAIAAGALPTAGWLATACYARDMAVRLRTDRLTGLANRESLARAFARTVRRGGPAVGVLLLDLDGFKLVNDRHGHACGNTVLRHIGRRLSVGVESGQMPARLHGDEFAVLLTRLPLGAAGQRAAEEVAARVRDLVREPVPVAADELVVTASVGAAVSPRETARLSALLRVADQRMYAAKTAARRPGRHCSAAEREGSWSR